MKRKKKINNNKKQYNIACTLTICLTTLLPSCFRNLLFLFAALLFSSKAIERNEIQQKNQSNFRYFPSMYVSAESTTANQPSKNGYGSIRTAVRVPGTGTYPCFKMAGDQLICGTPVSHLSLTFIWPLLPKCRDTCWKSPVGRSKLESRGSWWAKKILYDGREKM